MKILSAIISFVILVILLFIILKPRQKSKTQILAFFKEQWPSIKRQIGELKENSKDCSFQEAYTDILNTISIVDKDITAHPEDYVVYLDSYCALESYIQKSINNHKNKSLKTIYTGILAIVKNFENQAPGNIKTYLRLRRSLS